MHAPDHLPAHQTFGTRSSNDSDSEGMHALLVALACLGTLVLGLLVYFVLKKRDERNPSSSHHGNNRTTQSGGCAIEILHIPNPPPYDSGDVPPPYSEGEIDLGEAPHLVHVTSLDFAPPPYVAVEGDPPPYSETSGESSSLNSDVIHIQQP